MLSEALLNTLHCILRVVEQLGVPSAVMGGIALSAWGHLRATKDVDVLVAFAAWDVDALVARMGQIGMRPKHAPPLVTVGDLQILQFLYEPPETFVDVQVDLLAGASEYHQTVLERRVAVTLPQLDTPVNIVSCEDMILLKLLAGRVLDRVDAAAVLRNNRLDLDQDYLQRWAERLRLSAELADIDTGSSAG